MRLPFKHLNQFNKVWGAQHKAGPEHQTRPHHRRTRASEQTRLKQTRAVRTEHQTRSHHKQTRAPKQATSRPDQTKASRPEHQTRVWLSGPWTPSRPGGVRCWHASGRNPDHAGNNPCRSHNPAVGKVHTNFEADGLLLTLLPPR